MVELLPAAIDSGLKLAVTPGSLDCAESATVPPLPMTVVLIVVVGFGPPCCMLIALGLAEIVKSCWTPIPCRGTDRDPPATLPVNVRLPVRSPAAVGAKLTKTTQVDPAASGFGAFGQSVADEIAKSPVIDMLVISGPVPELTANVCPDEVEPISTEPNSRVD